MFLKIYCCVIYFLSCALVHCKTQNGSCSTALNEDECGHCIVESDPLWNDCVGCDDVPNSGKSFNECGRCVLETDPFFDDYGTDCRGICASSLSDTYYVDNCGVCLLPSDAKWNECLLATSQPTKHAAKACSDGIGSVESDDFRVSMGFNCTLQSITFDITYNGYKANWFGIVLNYSMIGSALIYTTGKSTEQFREPGLYWYSIRNHSTSGINYYDLDMYLMDHKFWYEISTEEYDDNIRVKYAMQTPANTFDVNKVFKWAHGATENDLTLTYHHQNIANDVSVLSYTTATYPSTSATELASTQVTKTTEKPPEIGLFEDNDEDKKEGSPLIMILFIVIGVLLLLFLLCLCAGYVFYMKYAKPKNQHLSYVRNIQMDLEDQTTALAQTGAL